MPLRTFVRLFAVLSITGIASAQNVPKSSHVWVINEENHSFEEVIGNPQMPYYNQLAQEYGLATQFYSDQHSSLPALMWFVAGAAVETNNDTVSCEHSEDNVVRELLKRGYTWKSYQVDMPSAGFQGLDGGPDDLYVRRHNPLVDFTDVCPGTGQDTNSVPFPQMATDFSDGKIPNYTWITPDLNDDAHNGTLQEADEWLQANVPAILARPEFSPGGDGILFIVWDESDVTDGDNRCSATVSEGCGGRTATLVIGPQVKKGYQSTITYHGENVLATVCATMGLAPCPGAAETAAPMADFFTTDAASGNPTNSVVITTPGNGATIAGAVHLMATASESQTVNQVQVWDNGTKLGWYPSTAVNQVYNLAPGKHTTTVLDENSSYQVLHGNSVSYTVQALKDGVQIAAPAANETIVDSTVHVVAEANESVPISQMQVWDNGVKLGWFAGSTVNQFFALEPGLHRVTVLDLDDQSQIVHEASVTYRVQ
ncbi:MAG: alkaline phosphatase family protein [Acidobacteriaceae bacterium]